MVYVIVQVGAPQIEKKKIIYFESTSRERGRNMRTYIYRERGSNSINSSIVVNSGCANAGKQGLDDAWAMVRETDALLPSHFSKFEHETLVMSTGVIGQNLPISKIVAGIRSQSEKESLVS